MALIEYRAWSLNVDSHASNVDVTQKKTTESTLWDYVSFEIIQITIHMECKVRPE